MRDDIVGFVAGVGGAAEVIALVGCRAGNAKPRALVAGLYAVTEQAIGALEGLTGAHPDGIAGVQDCAIGAVVAGSPREDRSHLAAPGGGITLGLQAAGVRRAVTNHDRVRVVLAETVLALRCPVAGVAVIDAVGICCTARAGGGGVQIRADTLPVETEIIERAEVTVVTRTGLRRVLTSVANIAVVRCADVVVITGDVHRYVLDGVCQLVAVVLCAWVVVVDRRWCTRRTAVHGVAGLCSITEDPIVTDEGISGTAS
jgi:hypothetical protein